MFSILRSRRGEIPELVSSAIVDSFLGIGNFLGANIVAGLSSSVIFPSSSSPSKSESSDYNSILFKSAVAENP